MESTIRIDYNSSPASPVIKIITPKSLNEDSDPKDRLVQDLLRTASVTDRNNLFQVQVSFPLESSFNLTTLVPIRYFDEPDELRKYVERRVMGFEDICECQEFETTIVPEMNEEVKNAIKAPADYARYLEIKRFFNWVSEQPYVQKPQ